MEFFMAGQVASQGNAAAPVEHELLPLLLHSNLPDAIYFKDLRRRYIKLNQAECEILGVGAPGAVIGKTPDHLVSAQRSRMWRREELDVIVTGVPLIDRVEKVARPDGNTQWLSATKVAMRDEAGVIVGLIGITRDITQHKLHEAQRDQFISTVSHELRTPATSILGSLALVNSGAAGALPEAAARLLKIAKGNCERLVRLVNDLLDLQKMEAGMMQFVLEPVDVCALLRTEVETIQSFAGPYGVKVRLEEGDGPLMVRADAERLAQAIDNLLSNAVKYAPRGSEVVVWCEESGGEVSVSVRDHGPGVPDAFKERIFDKFVQVDGHNKKGKGGTGLGLSVVKQIAERLHGCVGFEPAPGGGSIFSIVLPRLLANDSAHAVAAGGKARAQR
jgi:PAS domain S-box-containing protein